MKKTWTKLLPLLLLSLFVGLFQISAAAEGPEAFYIGNAIHFNDTDDSLSTDYLTTQVDNITMEAWVKADTSSSSNTNVRIMYNGDSANNGYGIYLHGDNNKPSILIGNVVFLDAGISLEPSKWYHLAAVRDSGTWSLYVNGTAVGLTGTVTSDPNAPTSDGSGTGFSIGNRPDLEENFTGKIDEVRFWTVARTAAEIKDNMYIKLSGSETGLLAYYNFDQAGITPGGNNTAITTVTNVAGEDNNLNISNFTKNGTTSNFVQSVNLGSFALSSDTYSVLSVMPSLEIPVTRTGGSEGSVTLNYTATGVFKSEKINDIGTVTFAEGETSKNITINGIDVLTSGFVPETFTVTISGPAGVTIGTGSATVTIVPNTDVLWGPCTGDEEPTEWSSSGTIDLAVYYANNNSGTYIKLLRNVNLTDGYSLGFNRNTTTVLDLNGKTITQKGSNCVISAGGSLTLKDSASGGTITGGSIDNGGGIYVAQFGELNMTGGIITGNTAEYDPVGFGGGVYVEREAAFNMSGGSITGNTAYGNGGGVYVSGGAAFTMSGGSITGNTATVSETDVDGYGGLGGGVCVSDAVANVIGYNAAFTMSGGSITGNTASGYGGGVYTYGDFSISGDADISGNTIGTAANNVYLVSSKTITVDEALTGSTPIGVTTEAAPANGSPVAITGTNSADYSGSFSSDNAAYETYDDAGAVKLRLLSYNVTLTDSDDGITGFKYSRDSTNGSDGTWADYTSPVAVSQGYSLYVKSILAEGYTFEKWAAGLTANPYKITSTDDVSFSPTSTASTYTVTLDRKGGEGGSESFTATYNSIDNAGYVSPHRQGYTFGGYYTGVNGAGLKVLDVSSTMFVKNVSGYTDEDGKWIKDSSVTLYAKWTPDAPTVTLEADNGGSVSYGETVTLTADAHHDASVTFTYAWYKDNSETAISGETGSTLELTSVADSGSYKVRVTATDADSLVAEKTSDAVSVTISPAAPMVIAWPTASGVTYGAALSASALSGGAGAGFFAWKTGTTVPTVTNSGYAVVFTPTDTVNYESVEQAVSIAVSPKPVALTWSGYEALVYNGSAKSVTATVNSASLVGEDACTVTSYTENAETNAGGYTATATALSNSNYTLTGGTGTSQAYAIAKAPVSFTVSGSTKDYTGGDLAATVQQTTSQTPSVAGNYSVAYKKDGSVVTPKNAGTYEVWVTLTSNNFKFSGEQDTTRGKKVGELTVNSVSAAVVWSSSASYTYDGTLRSGTVTAKITGKGSEGEIALDVAYLGTAGAASGKTEFRNAGSYTATASTTNGNYTLTNNGKALTISPLTAALSWSGYENLVYDGTAKNVTATVSNLMYQGDTKDTCTVTVTDGDKINAGASYTATATALSSGNYELPAGVTRSYAIAKAPISFTVTGNIHVFDNAAHTATVAQTAAETPRIGENKFSVSYKLPTAAVDTAASSQTDYGEYDVLVSLDDDNFRFAGQSDGTRTYKVGTLTIGKIQTTVLWKNTTVVYNGEPQSPTLELVGVNAGDNVTVALEQSKTAAGTHAVTAALSGADAGNYTLTNPAGTFIIQRAPVSFTLSGSSVKQGEAVSVTAAPSVPGVTTTLTYRKGGVQVTPSEAGAYDIYAELTGSNADNYRHAGSADGAARKIGVLTIYQSTPPTTYSVSFDASGGTGETGELTGAQAGTVRVLPANGFTSAGKTFAGWQYGGKTYKPGDSFSQPAADVTFKALWSDNVYSIDGVVKEGDPAALASNVVVTLMLGSEQLGHATTNSEGAFAFGGVLPGVYNLVANKDGVTNTTMVTIADSAAAGLIITMPVGKLNSIVEVKAGSPAIVVGNLEEAFTEAEKEAAALGGQSVELKLTAEAKPADSLTDNQQKIEEKAGNVDLFLELTLTKTVTDHEGAASTTELDASHVLLKAVIPLPAELQGMDSYTVYRYHGNEVQTLTTTANAEQERIEVNQDKTALTVYTKNFSEYAIKGVNHSSYPSYSGHYSDTRDPSADEASDCKLTFEVSGGDDIEPLTMGYGAVIDLSAYTPVREGFTFGGWYSDAELTKEVTSLQLTADAAVYAKWEEASTLSFSDVDESDWFYADVAYVFEKGLMQGAGRTTFDPYADTTRGMLVTILWRLDNEPEAANTMTFTDVEKGKYYYSATQWAAENKIVQGYDTEAFGPENPVTREQMAAILFRYAKYKGYDVSAAAALSQFKDADQTASWAAEAIRWANAKGLITGKGNCILDPQGSAERCQIAAVMRRFCEDIQK